MENKIKILSERIISIKKELSELGDMHPGSLSTQYNVCGNKTCACKDPVNPKKHGPYNQLSFSRRGKSSTRFIKEHNLEEIRKQVDNHRRFRELNEEWIDISVEIANLKKQIEIAKLKKLKAKKNN